MPKEYSVLHFSRLFAALGRLLFGFDTAIISGVFLLLIGVKGRIFAQNSNPNLITLSDKVIEVGSIEISVKPWEIFTLRIIK